MDEQLIPQTILETEDELPEEQEQQGTGITPEALQAILADNRRLNADLVRQMAPQRGPLQQDSVNPEFTISLDGLPDPAHDIRAFNIELAKRVGARVNDHVARATSAVEQRLDAKRASSDAAARANAMIKAANPNLTDEVIGAGAAAVIRQMKAEGLDPQAELMRDPEVVATRVLDWTDDQIARLTGGQTPQRVAPGETNGRTRGLVQPRSRAPARPQGRNRDVEDPRELFRELTGVQHKARIY